MHLRVCVGVCLRNCIFGCICVYVFFLRVCAFLRVGAYVGLHKWTYACMVKHGCERTYAISKTCVFMSAYVALRMFVEMYCFWRRMTAFARVRVQVFSFMIMCACRDRWGSCIYVCGCKLMHTCVHAQMCSRPRALLRMVSPTLVGAARYAYFTNCKCMCECSHALCMWRGYVHEELRPYVSVNVSLPLHVWNLRECTYVCMFDYA